MGEKEKAKYEATAADLSKAVSSLEGAIADMQAGKGASFLSVKKGIRKSIAIADALDLSPKQQRSITALLQTDADDAPEGDFAFHGDDIIATLEDLEKEFKAKKAEVDQIEGQNKKDFNEVMKSKTNEKKTAEGDKKTAEGEKDTADENIAKATEDMVKEEALLKDDELYLKDLTAKCELKAREWDQRSQMRGEEVFLPLPTASNIVCISFNPSHRHGKGNEGNEGDEEEGGHEGHEGDEEEVREQDCQGRHVQGHGAPWKQGEDRGGLTAKDLIKN